MTTDRANRHKPHLGRRAATDHARRARTRSTRSAVAKAGAGCCCAETPTAACTGAGRASGADAEEWVRERRRDYVDRILAGEAAHLVLYAATTRLAARAGHVGHTPPAGGADADTRPGSVARHAAGCAVAGQCATPALTA